MPAAGRIALIINEFGDLGVDGEVLKGCGEETCSEDDIVELTNGCICCTVADDFIPAMEKLLERENRPDHIVIETSGLALPQPLVAAFNWPAIKTQVTVDGVVTVVDSAAVAAGRFADDPTKVDAQRSVDPSLDHESPLEELFEDQLAAADLVVLNKADLIDAAGLEAVRAEIGTRSRRTPAMIEASGGAVPADVLLGLGVGTEEDIANRKSHHELEHENGEPHDHDEFASFVVELGPVLAPGGVRRAPCRGGRAPRRAEAQGVRRRARQADAARRPGGRDRASTTISTAPGERARPRATRLVVIGLSQMDQGAVRSAISAAFGEAQVA